ncbi:hemoblobin-interacting domain-containing protein [Lacrimispora sp.]|uniref:hemoblobin-interacting domain-containing protein n=1 Tax=Lacrimispora sp. TaxID=2719234 RepID=UPI002FD94FC6
MARKKLIQKTAVSLLTAACVLSQIGTVWAGVAGNQGGAYTQGVWKYENESWKHYDGSGALSFGWIKKESGWYYLNPEDGTMMTGWFQDEKGTKYYMNTSADGTEGQMRSGWYQDGNGTWYFFNTADDGTLGGLKTGWQWIDGYCYYFHAGDGADMGRLYIGETTPDGFFVNGDGRWADSDGTVHYEAGKGLASTPEAESAKRVAASGTGRVSSGGSGSSGGGSSTDNGNNQNGENNHQEEKSAFVNEKKTKLVDLGWIQYAVIVFQEGSIDDYTVSVDGMDITDVCANVDDDGTVVKWQTTLWKPGTLTVTRDSDGKEQKVKIGNGSASGVSDMGNLDSAPSAILTNGPISVFDYHLDNYDRDGNVRIHPEKTTFYLSGELQEAFPEVPSDYYLPDTLIDPDGKGKIQLKLALKTQAQESWFAQLKTIKALSTENNVLNKNLTFTTSIETEFGKTGVITIGLPQTNLFARGRYQLNLSSGYSKATKNVPLHLVDNRLFVMNLNNLNPSPKQGEDFAFEIVGPAGENFGTEILSPIYRVDMTMPSGKVKSLAWPEEYYEIGSMLHICGTDPDDNVITTESGIYTITVYATGYQTMTKKVEVGSSSQSGAGGYSIQAMAGNYTIDAMASASVVIPDEGGSGSSGGSQMNGYLIFDHDLLANALILHEINHVSEESEAVVQWWYNQKAQSVMDENAETFYDFTHYLNSVKDAKLETGEYLSFEKYKEIQTGGETANRPYQIKRVLEDGKLGAVERLLSIIGKPGSALKGMEGNLGEDLVLTSDKDGEYISKITALYLNDSAIALRSDSYITEYKFGEEKESIIILSKTEGTGGGRLQLTEGEHKLRIVAEGYKDQTVVLNVVRELERLDLSLADNPEKEDSEDATIYHMGQKVYINAAADEADASQTKLRGDFMKNLTGVTLTDPDEMSKNVTLQGQGGLYSEDNYEKQEYSFALQKNLFKKAGQYTVLVTAEGYTAKTLTFEIMEAAAGPVEDNKLAPEVEKTEYMEGSIWDPAYYRVTFDVTDEKATKDYLNAEKTVTVNGISYKKVSSWPWPVSTENLYKTYSVNGVVKYLDFTATAFTEDENTVVIEVDGYETLTFTVELFDPENDIQGRTASAAEVKEENPIAPEEEITDTEEDKPEEPEEETGEAEENQQENGKDETVETEGEDGKENAEDKTGEPGEETGTGEDTFESQGEEQEEEKEENGDAREVADGAAGE